jgi:hypothetical protein
MAEVKSHMGISAYDDRKSVAMRLTDEVFVRNAGVLFQPRERVSRLDWHELIIGLS